MYIRLWGFGVYHLNLDDDHPEQLKLKIMIITRKIQIYVCEEDKDLRKDFVHTIYQWRDLVRRGANTIVAHKFAQENIKDFIYIKDEIKDKFYVKIS